MKILNLLSIAEIGLIFWLGGILLRMPSAIDYKILILSKKEMDIAYLLLKSKASPSMLNSSDFKSILQGLDYVSVTYKQNSFAYISNSSALRPAASSYFDNFCIIVNGSLACVEVGLT